MKPLSAFKLFLLTRFSKPACDREIYQSIKKYRLKSIVELGLGNGSRAEMMIRVAQKFSATESIRYTGIDLFEARENASEKLTLKEMHKRVHTFGVKAQLVPGNPEMAIARIANSHLRTDLILISGVYCEADLASCWVYFPRMLHAQSIVMVQAAPGEKFQTFSRLEIEKRAGQTKYRASAAA